MRIEKDTLGTVKLPDKAYYGAQTQRAVHNFPISGLRLPRCFIRAQGIVKLAAVRANGSLGMLKKGMVRAVERAAREVIKGVHDSEFVVDVYQAGAGTSQNMNANEVIANRAAELLGGSRGDYSIVHPNDHVNMAQSTNDTIPTAMYIAAYESVSENLIPSLRELHAVLKSRARAYDSIVKAGRTHLQDAVPVRLGQEFSGYAQSVKNDILRIEHAAKSLLYLPIGGNALGTGINAHKDFRITVIKEIAAITGISFKCCKNAFEGIQNVYPALEISAALRGMAVTMTKIANDLRLLSSGPRTGLAEIRLPAVQPGSSIMPGKVNPVMAEMLNMVCYQIIGNDTAVAYAVQASQMDLNVMMPVIAHNVLFSIEIASSAIGSFTERCVRGIEADKDRCRDYADSTLAMATALNPVIGYSKAAAISKEAYSSGKSVKSLTVEKGILNKQEAGRVLDPDRLTRK